MHETDGASDGITKHTNTTTNITIIVTSTTTITDNDAVVY